MNYMTAFHRTISGLSVAMLLLLGACKKDTRSIDLNVTAVPALYTPVDGQYI
jgi:hypothetical protein